MIENKNIYVGNRYVPLILGVWNQLESYEGLSVVLWEGTSYTSKKSVPTGVLISNEEYWAVTGNYNAQVENYRQEVNEISEDLTNYKDEVNTQLTHNIAQIQAYDFGALGDGITNDTTALQNALNEAERTKAHHVYLENGKTYLITQLIVPPQVSLVGGNHVSFDGLSTSIKNVANNQNGEFIILKRGSGLYNLHVNGNKANNTMVTNGVCMTDAGVKIRNVNIHDFTGTNLDGGSIDGSITDVKLAGALKYGMNIRMVNGQGTDMRFENLRVSGNLDGGLIETGANQMHQVKFFLNHRDGLIIPSGGSLMGTAIEAQENGRHGIVLDSCVTNHFSFTSNGNGATNYPSEENEKGINLVMNNAKRNTLTGIIKNPLWMKYKSLKGVQINGDSYDNQLNLSVNSGNEYDISAGVNRFFIYYLQDNTSHYNQIIINGVDRGNNQSMSYDRQLSKNFDSGLLKPVFGLGADVTAKPDYKTNGILLSADSANTNVKGLTYVTQVKQGELLNVIAKINVDSLIGSTDFGIYVNEQNNLGEGLALKQYTFRYNSDDVVNKNQFKEFLASHSVIQQATTQVKITIGGTGVKWSANLFDLIVSKNRG